MRASLSYIRYVLFGALLVILKGNFKSISDGSLLYNENFKSYAKRQLKTLSFYSFSPPAPVYNDYT